MRPALWLVLLLVASVALAGCSKPRLADRDGGKDEDAAATAPRITTELGADISYVGEPTWRPGWHFAYEGQGAYEGTSVHSGKAGDHTDTDASTWGPREEFNYTVVQLNSSLGETRFLALQAGPAAELTGPLLAFDPLHLKPRAAYVSDYCNYSFYSMVPQCLPTLQLIDAEDEAPPLDFPLRDGRVDKDVIESSDRPYIPLDPINVATQVLGMKEVDGPFGPVQAVHVHQEFAVNFTRALATWGATADQMQTGQSAQSLTGNVRGVRDVYYAPTLSNVVLDVASSEGTYNGSYVEDGANETFEESFRTWSSQRLVNATFEERAPMTMQEISGRLSAADASELPYAGRLLLEGEGGFANVAAGESLRFRARMLDGTAPAALRYKVLDAEGFTVHSGEGADLDFRPDIVGPYLVVAEAFNATGASIGRDFRTVGAYYEGSTPEMLCDPVVVDPLTGCPSVLVPIGPILSYVMLLGGSSSMGLAAGELVLDTGMGHTIHSHGSIYLQAPQVEPNAQWTLTYQPMAGAAQSVVYEMDVWPGPLPSFVYRMALGDEYAYYSYYH